MPEHTEAMPAEDEPVEGAPEGDDEDLEDEEESAA